MSLTLHQINTIRQKLGFRKLAIDEFEGRQDAFMNVLRKAFDPPKIDSPTQGTLLRGARHKENLTQAKLAELVGIGRQRISEMELGQRPINEAMAKTLGRILKVDHRIFLKEGV